MQMSNYGMFSDEGNDAIRALIQKAQVENLRWIDVYRELQELATLEGYEEAMDTAVREIVYDALVYKDNFYDV
jgi:hypothetical protein